jgi:hypothetical protein
VNDGLVEVWCGDQFIDVMTYTEYQYLYESNASLWHSFWFQWCEGYGP